MSADGKDVADVVKDGTRHIIIPFTRKITPWQDLICLWRLVREIKKLQPDIVHTHTPKAGLLGMLAAWICRIPIRLHTVAGLPLMEAHGFKRKVLEVAELVTYACAHVVYPNSTGLNKFISGHFKISPQKLRVIGKGSSNGIDTAFFIRSNDLETETRAVRREYGIGDGDVVFSFAGRIVRDKGIVELVKAFETTSRDFPSRKLLLLLIGDFEEAHDPLPTDILKFLTNDKRVILAGFQRDIRPWITASDVFVFPSYREGFPNVVMQASLLQVPCIVSDINGCNEIVEHDHTGLIVPAKDVTALVQAMKDMIQDEGKRKRYSIAARDYVAENFRREFIWEELRKEYDRMLSRKGVK